MADLDTPETAGAVGVGAFLRRRLAELSGLVLIAAGLAAAAALFSHNPADPSGNTATSIGDGGFRNLLGAVGAEISSQLVGSVGVVAAWALALVPVVWGVRILRHRPPAGMRRRLAVLPVAVVLLAFAAAAVNPDYGGAAGTVMANLILVDALRAAMPPPLETLEWSLVAAVAVALAGLALYVYAAAAGLAEIAFLPNLARSAGRGLARLLSWTARPFRPLARAAARLRAASAAAPSPPRKAPGPRREPVVVSSEPAGGDTPKRTAAKQGGRSGAGQRSLDLGSESGYRLPSADLLSPPGGMAGPPDEAVLDTNSRMLESVLAEFGVKGQISKARFGPVVTRYELVLAPGIKTQRVVGLSDDIARSMSATSVRIAVIPGENAIGIELPNADRQIVLVRDIFDGDKWAAKKADLPLALGMDIAGNPVVADLARMPHLLAAGTTGSGKSVGINGMILSLLYTHTPETCRFIMIDPKMLELSVYDGIPHLLTPVVTDSGKAVTALKWTVREMENRYRNMSKLGVRNIDGYNKRLEEARRKGENLTRRVQTGFDAETGMPVHEEQDLDLSPLPFIVVVIDEVADLMLVAGKDIEAAVQRLAQMARAAGIHVVMATQRPSVDVITGTIKANFPTRISYQVTSKIDSRTILGEQGAEQLLGKGDMLYMEGGGRIVRVHAPFVDEREVEAVAGFLREQGEPVYDDSVTTEVETGDGDGAEGDMAAGEGDGSLYDQAVALVTREGKASTSFIQRHLRIGYNRAATIIEDMERNGVVSPANHAGKREVLTDGMD